MRTSSKPWLRKENMTWYVEVGGRQVSLGKDKAEAKRRWLKLMAEGGQLKDRLFVECVEHYLAKLAPKTRRTRKQALDAFMEHVGAIRTSKLTKNHIRSFLKPGWSPSTARSAIKTILACLNLAVKDELITGNPVKDIEKPAWERLEHILTGEELDELFAAAREPFLTLVRAMADSGCRPQEICNLQIEDRFPDASIWLAANQTKNKPGVKKRPIYLTPDLVEITRKLMAGRAGGHLFLNRDGEPWTTDTIRCRFQPA